jgi:hypothetical protein
MTLYNSETTKAVRLASGGFLTIIFGYLFTASTLVSFTAAEDQTFSFLIFALSSLGCLVSSVLLGMGRQFGVRGVQIFSFFAILGLLLNISRESFSGLLFEVLIFSGASWLAEVVGRLVKARAIKDAILKA